MRGRVEIGRASSAQPISVPKISMRVFGLIFVVLQKCTAAEFFSSIAHMENLLQDEIETILEIRQYLEAHEEKIRIIRQKVDEIDSARVRYFDDRNY